MADAQHQRSTRPSLACGIRTAAIFPATNTAMYIVATLIPEASTSAGFTPICHRYRT
ncbi:hypothetical protein LN042_36245 [Kitasatospora sp. RB6PN24]|uniref:hypothetical protein n=1 Tax=Kitasatospora humi TaxID=2893891 RepID=UPI001E51C58B|nr:hypothetical protein [Kitasatospora humi]MCC9312443.1 hypothetical protein [Kitasatospora humi]